MSKNVTNELILEHLKDVQKRLSDVAGDVVDVKTDMRSLKCHMISFMQTELAQDGAISTM